MCYVIQRNQSNLLTFKNCQSINAESACDRNNKSMYSCFYESKKLLRCLNLIPNNESFKSRIESIQYKACVAITRAIQGTSRERLYRELVLESLSDRCWFRKLTFFVKFLKACLHDISLSTSIWGLPLITRLDLQIKTIYKNFSAKLKALSILSSLFVLENGIN